jgi:excisionase family DNA binding protein
MTDTAPGAEPVTDQAPARAAGAPPQLWTTAQVARHLNVDPVTVRRWISSGQLTAVRVGRGWRVDPRTLARTMRRSQPLTTAQVRVRMVNGTDGPDQ